MHFGDDIHVRADCIANGGHTVVAQTQDFIGERPVEVLLVPVAVAIHCDGIHFYRVIAFADGGQRRLCILLRLGQHIFIAAVPPTKL
ncbi:Uncharacterised protein [Salmonella enterica subsp. enterica serovar Typhi]|nr:Uncharacterised protein [Salmonella enterica subsp. enterica serovar Typhi]CXD10824.1 Uncharacterised protein [Salmonella enterica subsp. enterica serovar Typhi]